MPRHVEEDLPLNELVIALDVGGTNTRARIASAAGEGATTLAAPDVTTRSASRQNLDAFVAQVVRTAEPLGVVTAAVVAIAGPVVGGRSRVTNWATDSAICVADFERAGLPTGHTQLVNDATAGAWGAFARVDVASSEVRAQALTAHEVGEHGLGVGNLLYVAPGTGLSSAFVVRHGLGPLGASVVACEFENTQIPRLDGQIGLVIDAIASALGRQPDWEDLVSGRGLVRIYDALGSIAGSGSAGGASPSAHDARAIAEAARIGVDARARTASDVFYRTLGHFAQTLALACLPCAAVVIGGASTERNLELVRSSGLVATFAEHHRFSDLLDAIPLYAVGGEVNLEGAVRLVLQERRGPGSAR
jgi:glucokinase